MNAAGIHPSTDPVAALSAALEQGMEDAAKFGAPDTEWRLRFGLSLAIRRLKDHHPQLAAALRKFRDEAKRGESHV